MVEKRKQDCFWRKLRAISTRYIGTSQGHAAILFTFMAVPIVGAAGLAVDTGRAYLVENRLVQAIDAAGLAAARVSSSDRAETDALYFFNANFPDAYMSSDILSFDYSTRADNEYTKVSAKAVMPTMFMHILGKEKIHISHSAEFQRLSSGLEMALVMDTTGSMAHEGKMPAMKDASKTLIEILFGEYKIKKNVWISVVPYVASVNIGNRNGNWLVDPSKVEENIGQYGIDGWKGCVEARTQTVYGIPGDESDHEPDRLISSTLFPLYLYLPAADNDYDPNIASTIRSENSARSEGTGPNLACGAPVSPLTNVRDDLIEKIDSLLPWQRGGTASNLGMVWGWRTISPNWQGSWPGLEKAWEGSNNTLDMPLDYDVSSMKKVVVLLTDGDNVFNNSDYTAYGRLSDWKPSYSSLAGKKELDLKLIRVCTAMKDKGIMIYTITFGFEVNSETRSIYKACASEDGEYFHAPGKKSLERSFREIGQNLSNIRVIQ